MNRLIKKIISFLRWATFAIAILFSIAAISMLFDEKQPTGGAIVGFIFAFILFLPTLLWLKKRKRSSNRLMAEIDQSPEIVLKSCPASLSYEANQDEIGSYQDDKRRITFIKEEIARSPYIKRSHADIVLMRIVSLGAPINEEIFSLEEKKALGLNTRMKISKELYSCMTEKAMDDYENPKYIIEMLYNKATIRFYRHQNFDRMKESGAEYYIINSSKAALDECEWCKSVDGKKFPITKSYPDMVDRYCSCTPYCYGFASAYFPEFEDLGKWIRH